MIDQYFEMLEDWKLLPSYKLEVRIDSLVGFVLPKVLDDIMDIETKVVIPELPLRKGTLYEKYEDTKQQNLSFKIDFYVRTRDGQNLFLEFKSDTKSIREDQEDYLQRSVEIGMNEIVQGILKLWSNTPQKQKYDHLLSKMVEADLIEDDKAVQVEDDDIQIIYIKPSASNEDDAIEVIDYKHLAGSIRQCFPDEKLLLRFSDSLELWESD